MSKTIRTTMRPGEEILVEDAEYLQLRNMGLVFGEAAPGPPDPDDAEVAALLDDETSATYARLLAQLATAVPGGNALGVALRAAFVPSAGPSPALRRDFPMQLPRVLSSPPSTTPGVSGSSVVAGTVLVSAFEPGAFAFLGGRAVINDIAAPNPTGVNLGVYPYKTSPTPVTVEFWLDTVDPTGRFEAYWSGPASQSGMRVAVQQPDGSWGYVSAAATFSHSNSRADLVTLGAAGVYCIRLEFAANSVFHGVYVGPTDTVTATFRRKRWIVVGDSFTEPTIDDSGAFVHGDGWVQQLAYLTGYDLWSAGSGGTGYLNPGAAGANRVKFRDRLAADILAFQTDGILWAGGINDGTSTPADLAAEALLCWQAAKAAGVPEQVVLSPFWSKTLTASSPLNTIGQSDALKAAAASLGLPYLNLLELPEPTGRLGSWADTLQASAAAGATSISVATIPAYMQVAYVTKGGWYVKIVNGGNTEIRKVTNITGTGPYTLTLNSGLSFAQASGLPVVLSGASYMTGTGRQAAPTGSGNADRYIGGAGTHPTKAGMLHIARTVAGLWAQAIPA